MSFMDEYNALKRKRLSGTGLSTVSNGNSLEKPTDNGLTGSDFMDEYNRLKEQRLAAKSGNTSSGDIAPVSNQTYFKSGSFSDGYQTGDVIKTILGTVGDFGLDLFKGLGNLSEGIADTIGYGIADASDLIGDLSGYRNYHDYARDVREEVQKNTVSDVWLGGASNYVDQYSVLGDKSDALVEGIGYTASLMSSGQALGAAGLSTKAVSAITNLLMGTSAYGSGMNEAYQGGADDTQARTYGLISAGGEVISEMMFGGLGKSLNAIGFGKGLSSADDMLAKKEYNLLKTQIEKNNSE